jgi:ubiquinone biosynthesis protein
MLIGSRRVRHLRRYREIAGTLVCHGLGWLVMQLGLGDLVPFHWGWLGHPRRPEPYTQPDHVRIWVRISILRVGWRSSPSPCAMS